MKIVLGDLHGIIPSAAKFTNIDIYIGTCVDATEVVREPNTIKFKAILKTSDTTVSPKLESYKIRIG